MSEKSSPGRDALRVQVQRDVDQVEVAGALAVAEQAAFDAVGAGHQRELAGRGAGAAIVVRMHRQHDGVAPRQVAVHPLDHVGEDVGRRVLHRRRQVDDALALRASAARPRSRHRPRAWRTPARCRRTSRASTGRSSRVSGCCAASSLNRRAWRGRQLDDAVLVQAEHHPAHHRRGGVVQVHDGARRALQRLEGAADQLARAPASAPGSSRRRGCGLPRSACARSRTRSARPRESRPRSP